MLFSSDQVINEDRIQHNSDVSFVVGLCLFCGGVASVFPVGEGGGDLCGF